MPARRPRSAFYELPAGKGKLLNIDNASANDIIGGWQVGGILTLQSGIPETLTIGGLDNSVTQSAYDRPNATGGQFKRFETGWNHYEIVADRDHLAVVLSGTKTLDTHDSKFSDGRIRVQYQKFPIEFKNVKLRLITY